jgi:integrase/recombinase XerD
MANPPKRSWPNAIELFRTHLLARSFRPATVRDYLARLGRFVRYLERKGGRVGPGRVTLELLRDYQVGLLAGTAADKGRPVGAESVAITTSVLAIFFRFLVAEGVIARDPTLRLDKPRSAPRAPGDVLSVKEVEALLDAADTTSPLGLRDRAVAEVLYATGVRRAELLALDLADVDHGARELVVRDGKGGRGRVLPITRSAYERLEDYLARARPALVKPERMASTLLFLARHGGPMGDAALDKTLRRLARASGLEKRLTPHTLRRTFATQLLAAGASLRHIQLLLGHASLATTQVYLALDAGELRRAVILKHPREELGV